ncbi:40S ribosomal protein S5-1 [Hordeum vulgare]|nr:40S ribosomal protein S5-1 [Hordeum vulgare]
MEDTNSSLSPIDVSWRGATWTTRRELSAKLGAMASPKSPKDKFLVNVINPYLAEVKRHPQTLWVEDGVLHKEDLKGPIKEGSTRARLEEVEQEVFKYKLMIERGVEANCDIIAELKTEHEEETKEDPGD